MTIKNVGELSHEHLGKSLTITTRDGMFNGSLSYVSHDMVRNGRGSCVTIALSDESDSEISLDTLLYLPPETPCQQQQ